jgi:hypothetical protein
MAVLMANYGRTTRGWISAGKSVIWSEDGSLVAASVGTEEALIVGMKQDGIWRGVVVPLPAALSAVSPVSSA